VGDFPALYGLLAAYEARVRQLEEQIPAGPRPPRQPMFHNIEPVPTCCDQPMRRGGNLSLHVLDYQCDVCRQRLQAHVTFTCCKHGYPEPMPDAMRRALDEVP
jgi:hypothetical protein